MPEQKSRISILLPSSFADAFWLMSPKAWIKTGNNEIIKVETLDIKTPRDTVRRDNVSIDLGFKGNPFGQEGSGFDILVSELSSQNNAVQMVNPQRIQVKQNK